MKSRPRGFSTLTTMKDSRWFMITAIVFRKTRKREVRLEGAKGAVVAARPAAPSGTARAQSTAPKAHSPRRSQRAGCQVRRLQRRISALWPRCIWILLVGGAPGASLP